ncbi:MAG: hypothetical protein ACYDD7_15440, partial [Acidimicrobiales bacterium]
ATSIAAYAVPPTQYTQQYTQTPIGQFMLGSTLVSVNTAQSAVLNRLLSPFGITSNLDAVGYQGLVTNTTTLGKLATALGLTALTPDQVLASNVKVSTLVAAEINLLGPGTLSSCSGGASTSCSSAELGVLQTLLLASGYNSANQITIGSLLGIATGSGAALTTSVNLFDALIGSIEVADGNWAVSIPSLTLNAGIATVTTSVKAITRPGRSLVGPAPQTAQNTQVTATFDVSFPLNVSVLGIGYLLNVDLPVTVTAGGAQATMTAVGCPPVPGTTPTGLTIGPVSFTPAAAAVNGTATVALLGTATLTGSQAVVIGSDTTSPHALVYTANFPVAPPPGPAVVSVGSASSLPTSIALTVGGSGLLGTVVTAAKPTIQSTLTTALAAVNSLDLPTLLSTLGAQIGKADLSGLQATCPTPTLVG